VLLFSTNVFDWKGDLLNIKHVSVETSMQEQYYYAITCISHLTHSVFQELKRTRCYYNNNYVKNITQVVLFNTILSKCFLLDILLFFRSNKVTHFEWPRWIIPISHMKYPYSCFPFLNMFNMHFCTLISYYMYLWRT